MKEVKKIDVAIGIIQDTQKKIFITQRYKNVHFAGFWEFPGGKIEKNETPDIALARELFEETRITVRSASLLQMKKEIHDDLIICLYFYLVEEWEGEPCGYEGQKGKWVNKSELSALRFPPANDSVITTLLLQK